MSACLDLVRSPHAASANPFDLDDERAYRIWRDAKLADAPRSIEALMVEVHDPAALRATEREAILARCARFNMALYHSPATREDTGLPRALGRQLGLARLDANWLADDDGISPITVRSGTGEPPAGAFIPYTTRAIRWHTDGYYQPSERAIRGMILHCVRPAASGGANRLLDHELAYIALRDASPAHIAALMADDAMTIPAREDEDGVARPAQTGPVFSVAPDGALHMRYTARTRSIEWKNDAATRAAVGCLETVLAESPHVLRLRMEAGMGLVANNVLHDREAFIDDPARPRLLYRARYLDRVPPRSLPVAAPQGGSCSGPAEPDPRKLLDGVPHTALC
ncbi:TauD/TfdA family dioxygenase [Ideonella sp.]|uniref:TauD/TfdA family dioxygenase n=1 Tax=Ideonella sp. TaxID=1929293 RepID=UPI002B4806F2|nr:TauD/TfdA family dioxygenase [Ideonella sp.]HJV70576.1 TauD/TfdA family dioxygenase [Ideonella sp.]